MIPVVRNTLLCVMATLMVIACGPNAKNESQYWENHKKAATEHGARWTGFKGLLEETIKTAEPKWKEASENSNEEEQAKAMKAVNAAVGKLIGRLSEVKSKSDGLRDSINKLNAMKLDKKKGKDRKKAVKKAEKALEEVDQIMKDAKPEDEAAALAAMEPAISKLISAQSSLKGSIKALSPDKPKKDGEKKSSKKDKKGKKDKKK